MLTHVENVVNKNWLQKLSHLLRLFSYRSNKTSKCGQVKQYAGLCDTLTYRSHHATSLICSFWSRLKATTGVSWDRPTATGCVPFCFLAQRFSSHVFRQIVTSVGTLSSANLFALKGMGKRPHLAPLGLTWRAIFLFVWPTGVKNKLEFSHLRLKRSRVFVVSLWVMGCWRRSKTRLL